MNVGTTVTKLQSQTAKSEENEQTNDTGGNQTRPAKHHEACSNLGRGGLAAGKGANDHWDTSFQLLDHVAWIGSLWG